MKGRFFACLAFGVGAALSAIIIAQAASSTRNGVYTDAQAQQGHALYTAQCALCHGPQLQGSGQNPPLTGPAFLHNWSGQTVADLYTQIKMTMPAIKPGSLQPDQVAQAIAYILSVNKYPAGNAPLPVSPDALKAIQIDPPAAAGN